MVNKVVKITRIRSPLPAGIEKVPINRNNNFTAINVTMTDGVIVTDLDKLTEIEEEEETERLPERDSSQNWPVLPPERYTRF